MKINVYCDENLPDLFTSKKITDKKLMIGSLWIEDGLNEQLKDSIKNLREEYNCWGEIKWTKVSPNKEKFYLSLVNLFFSYGLQMRFRCIAIDPKQINWSYHNDDKELGFYKFYFLVLDKWINEFKDYNIFCDIKANRDLRRLNKLHEILQTANRTSTIHRVQALPSKEVVLIQLSDLLLGAASSAINNIPLKNPAKINLIKTLEKHLGKTLAPTYQSEDKFNIFDLKLNGTW